METVPCDLVDGFSSEDEGGTEEESVWGRLFPAGSSFTSFGKNLKGASQGRGFDFWGKWRDVFSVCGDCQCVTASTTCVVERVASPGHSDWGFNFGSWLWWLSGKGCFLLLFAIG